jgi:hypothetical protein
LRGSHDVSGHPDDEQVAQALVEDDLGRHARIGAPQDDREGLLARHQLGAFRAAGQGDPRLARGKPAVPFPQALQRLRSRDRQ